MLDVAETCERERVAVGHLETPQTGDGRMHGDEPVPLPGHRVESEHVAQQYAVGACMRDDGNPQVGVGNLPQWQCVTRPPHTDAVQEVVGATTDPLDEVSRSLPTFDSYPAVVGRPASLLLVGKMDKL